MSQLVLGIDVGTTSVKVVIVQKQTQAILANQSKDTQANVPSDLGIEGNKQDVPKILSALHNCLSRLPKDLLRQVGSIGICGQMHGVTLWKLPNECSYKENGEFKLDIDKDKVSNLYTWQDGRCDTDFLKSLPKSKSHLAVHTGYGCATLFWFAKNKPEKLKKYDKCGTMQDLVVSLLSANDDVKMSTQNAASWGYFLTETNQWDNDALSSGGFPFHLLPAEILMPGQTAGTLAHTWFGIPAGTTIGVALGDLQSSVFALLKQPTDAVLNISTSAQLAFVRPTFKPETNSELQKIEYFPYFGDKYLAVAASLNGGNTLATFVKSLQQWTLELGFSVPQSKVWNKLIALGTDDSSISDMTIIPTLLGERYDPDQTASVTGITLDTLNLGNIFRALCSGIIKNLHDMISRDELKSAGITRIVGNGSGLVRNPVLQKEVSHWYNLPLEFGNTGDAALGAALATIESNLDR
ncbi:PREDICTED: sedoheptulokinase-like [Ceratosolen solmsi marchali]|uniref:Sedoheptulokinase n=1 Tax=Ceratosolen solmsi marchali TaxID=326594 RepID=A0AAJ7E3D8_9HYME|nr:PREDICTED: sedoheptulokinase-like [Ceratosolen solmsi marchali]XP_011506365.1 PREDICTED: sedoheptulokinase-like [Ceratosolen solmsi marchali]